MDYTQIIPLLQTNPITSIVIVSIVVTLISSLITKWVTNQEHLKTLKARQKELQSEMKKHKDNPKKLQEIQMEMMQITGTMMKSSFKPMLVTFIPFLLLAYWLNSIYLPTPMGRWWILYYIISSLVASLIFRKLLKMA